MSFATDIKNEISKLEFSKSENIAELSAMVRTAAKYTEKRIEISTENPKIAKRIYMFFKDLYNINAEIEKLKSPTFNKNLIYTVIVEDKVLTILKDLSVTDEKNKYIEMPEEYIIDSTEEVKAYLRGIFLAKGSVNDPKTSRYHLEFLFDKKYESVFVQRLLNSFELNSKIIMRDMKYMVYIKDSEKISDFLKIINASIGVLYYENIRAYKEQKNVTNRLNNCEQANTDKIIATNDKIINDIETIREKIGLDILDDKIKEACEYRIKYPEASLTELSEIISLETNSKITKSGLNHRFRRLREISNKLKGE